MSEGCTRDSVSGAHRYRISRYGGGLRGVRFHRVIRDEMGNSVSELLSRSYNYLGVPTQDKINLGLMLPLLLDTVDFFLLDLQISDENWLLKSFIFNPISKDDDIVTAPGFSVPVLMEIRDIGSVSDSDWIGILTANASDIQALGRDGTRAVAFYGQAFQSKMRWSFDPVNDWQVEARLWYEPVASQPSSLTDSPKLSQAFAAMIALRCAWTAVPYCGFEMKEAMALRTALKEDCDEWKRKWHVWVYSDKNATVIQKRDFRGSRRRFGRVGFTGWGW